MHQQRAQHVAGEAGDAPEDAEDGPGDDVVREVEPGRRPAVRRAVRQLRLQRDQGTPMPLDLAKDL